MHSKFLSGAVLFAGISPLASAIVIKGAMIDRRSPVSNSLSSPLEERGLSFCEPIKKIVDLLKVQQATAFCSSYLKIGTVSIPATQVVQTYTTTTATVEETITAIVTAATDVLTFAETEVIATLPTIVATDTLVVDSTTTVFSTPPAKTVTTTTYTTAAAAKRDVEAEKRNIKVPPFIGGFAPSVISKACSCLELPTPTVTVTATSVNSNTVQTQTTKTKTNTKYITVTVSTTETAKVTTYSPTTATVTSTNVVTETSVLPEQTITSTKTLAFRPQCTSLLAKSRLVQYVVTPGRRAAYSPINEPRLPGDGASEYTHSLCCEMAYEIKDVLFSAVLNERDGLWTCRRYYSYDTAPSGASEQCPKGRPSGEYTGPRVGAYELYKSNIVGPCLGFDGAL
ncbi:hypothetical protein TWF225_010256 [Orbilia oligospora]|nr:hypothetical protein TWF225_010256 [Orbilia oligospora]KAF3249694.1 hypothetical protein TWF128_007705 [Orbilia oligospora]KAF3261529.1 hypothetical protein TWF217_004657 [Orbilia oligospora]KAF3298537.1 hypothetical protein TWF132_000341 [Orbilia oligospora]